MRGPKVLVTLVGPGERVRDPEGRWSAVGDPLVVRAHVAPAASQYSTRSGVDRTKDTGVVLLPRDTGVTTEHVVTIEGARSLPTGTYRVMHVTLTAKHARCLVLHTRPVSS